MQAEKFVKTQPLENIEISPANNLITYHINDGTYDMSESYVSLTVYPNVTPYDNGNGNGLIPYYLKNSSLYDRNGNNGSFVKNARLKCENYGRLEDIRNTNIIHQDIYQRSNSFAEKESLNYINSNPLVNDYNIMQGYNLYLNKTGTTMSDFTQSYEMQIPLKTFLQLGNMKALNVSQLGKMEIKMEIDAKSIIPQSYCEEGGDDNLDFGGEKNRNMQDISENTASITQLKTKQKLGMDLDSSPYFVGQSIQIDATGAGGASNLSSVNAVISGIQISMNGDADDYKLILTLSNSIGSTGAGETYTDVKIKGGKSPPNTYGNNFKLFPGELVLKKIRDMKMDVLQYLTITNESDNANGLTTFRNQYYLEPECIAMYMIHTGVNSDSIVSDGGSADYIKLYRIQIDQQDVAGNRDILDDSSLEREMMNKTYLNLSLPLKETRHNQTVTEQSYYAQNSNSNDGKGTFIGTPTPLTSNRKILDIEIESKNGSTIHYLELFKFVVRTINLE